MSAASARRHHEKGAIDLRGRPRPRFLNVDVPERRSSTPRSSRRVLITGEAAQRLGMRRPQFVLLAHCLGFGAQERRGQRGGKPAKYYAGQDVALAKDLLNRCARVGGRRVLAGLLKRRG